VLIQLSNPTNNAAEIATGAPNPATEFISHPLEVDAKFLENRYT
jgi:hypothetical protein